MVTSRWDPLTVPISLSLRRNTLLGGPNALLGGLDALPGGLDALPGGLDALLGLKAVPVNVLKELLCRLGWLPDDDGQPLIIASIATGQFRKTCSTALRVKEHARSLPPHLHHLKYDVCLLREGLLAFLRPMHAKRRRGVTYSACWFVEKETSKKAEVKSRTRTRVVSIRML